MIKTSFTSSRKLPLAVEPESGDDPASLFSLAEDRRGPLNEQLLIHGALLFRGFEIKTVPDFENFVRLFSGREFFSYAGGVSPRHSLGTGIYTSTEYPPDVGLSLHNELSYAGVFPERLYFFCLTAPERGGETTLGDSRRILRSLDREVVETFKRKRICYIRNLLPGKGLGYSWQEAFETEDKGEVEARCRAIGARFEWRPGDCLRLSQIRPATVSHAVTGEEVWFNQADGFHPSNLGIPDYEAIGEDEFRLNACFGDGSPIDVEMLRHIREVLEEETIPHHWRQGDILVLDNILTAHGRRPFAGPRKIVLAMT